MAPIGPLHRPAGPARTAPGRAVCVDAPVRASAIKRRSSADWRRRAARQPPSRCRSYASSTASRARTSGRAATSTLASGRHRPAASARRCARRRRYVHSRVNRRRACRIDSAPASTTHQHDEPGWPMARAAPACSGRRCPREPHGGAAVAFEPAAPAAGAGVAGVLPAAPLSCPARCRLPPYAEPRHRP